MKYVTALVMICAAFDLDAQVDAFLGTWYAPDKDGSVIEVREVSDGKMEATIVSSDDRETIGMRIWSNARYYPEGHKIIGVLRKPGTRLTAKANITIEKEGRMKIQAKKGLFVKTVYWERK